MNTQMYSSKISYDNNLTRKPISIIDDIQNENVYCCIWNESSAELLFIVQLYTTNALQP